jgi:hypothetical protein
MRRRPPGLPMNTGLDSKDNHNKATPHHRRAPHCARRDHSGAGRRRVPDHREGPRRRRHRAALQDRCRQARRRRRHPGNGSARRELRLALSPGRRRRGGQVRHTDALDSADRSCTPQRYSAGEGFAERQHHVHLARNQGRTPPVVLVTHLGLKHGTLPLRGAARPNKEAVLEPARTLRRPQLYYARGIAMLELVLTAGTGPAYTDPTGEGLARQLALTVQGPTGRTAQIAQQ